ncbi:hypothetical protein SHIRM173S_10086 [Streptomyces hirsutus]
MGIDRGDLARYRRRRPISGARAARPARWRPRQHRRRPRPARYPDCVSSACSHDVFGALFHARVSASGVDLTGSVTAAPEPSTLAVADLDDSGQATYTFYADSAADWQWTDDELAGARLDDAACLHTGSLALMQQPGGSRIEDNLARAREHVTVSIDPNVRPLPGRPPSTANGFPAGAPSPTSFA